MSEKLVIPPPVLEEKKSILVDEKKSFISNFIRYLIVIFIFIAIILFIFVMWLNAMWDNAFSSGCWGFPGEDCS